MGYCILCRTAQGTGPDTIGFHTRSCSRSLYRFSVVCMSHFPFTGLPSLFKHTSGLVVVNGECESGSKYMYDEDLEDFPSGMPNIDNCSQLIVDNNRFTTLTNGHCRDCDVVRANNNRLTELTAPMLSGYPNVQKVAANNNTIRHIDGDALKGLKSLGVENNPLEGFPWDQADAGLKVSLAGTTLPCDCAMKRAEDRGVIIDTPPNCKGHPGMSYTDVWNTLQCSEFDRTQTTYPPTTGTWSVMGFFSNNQ